MKFNWWYSLLAIWVLINLIVVLGRMNACGYFDKSEDEE